MASCCFGNKVDHFYKCEYSINKEENEIEVIVDYDISDEIKPINGVRFECVETSYEDRDILIVDKETKNNYLLKSAYYIGASYSYGSPDGGAKTKFLTHVFIKHSDFNKLLSLPEKPKATTIQIFSKTLLDWIGTPSITEKKPDDAIEIVLSKRYPGEEISFNKNNIRTIKITDDWTYCKQKEYLTVDSNGYIELAFIKRVPYDELYEYVYEIQTFFQLYCPRKFLIDKIYVRINDVTYQLHLPLKSIRYEKKSIERIVQDNPLIFLEKCYLAIPYRKSKAEFRNIPYIVFKSSRNIEDNFLIFYRFIECYYKKQQIANIKTTFISYSIRKHYAKYHPSFDEKMIKNRSQEIITLRNHYVHSGYYIKNSSLKISFGKEKTPDDYTVNNIDANWILDRTKILFDIVIDIIYSEMLGYENYRRGVNY